MRQFALVLFLSAAAMVGGASLGRAADAPGLSTRALPLRASFHAETNVAPEREKSLPEPSSLGKLAAHSPYAADDRQRFDTASMYRQAVPRQPSAVTGSDVFVADGSEVALAVDAASSGRLVEVHNLSFPNMRVSRSAGSSWSTRTFPDGTGTFTGAAIDPWAIAGNTDGELFTSFYRIDTEGTGDTHTVIARTRNGGRTWSRFFEITRDVLQDRPMIDIDRTSALGGGPGTDHDGKLYVTYDEFNPNNGNYKASFLVVVSASGEELDALKVSTDSTFSGGAMQPVAGVEDGQVYLMAVEQNGGNLILDFHEVTEAGGNLNRNRSSIKFRRAGQALPRSRRYGVNGHRIGNHAFMDIDRTEGPRRGWLYVISDRNPNQSDPSLDQGDVWLSVSMDGARNWDSTAVPLATGKTQFFSMLDVDDNGWVHVAYYQNETGSTDDGVLNASTANLYYTYSMDGGASWASPVQVNDPANSLDYEDPPLDHSEQEFYLIGDYQQIRAAGTGEQTRVFVCWSGYDKDRSGIFAGDSKARVLCSETGPFPPAPPVPCVCCGDCNQDGEVAVDELVRALDIALGQLDPDACSTLDPDGSGQVTITMLVAAVKAALHGCGPLLSLVGSVGDVTGARDVAVGSDGRFVYVAQDRRLGGDAISIFERDEESGELKSRRDVQLEGEPLEIAVSPQGTNVYVTLRHLGVSVLDASGGSFTEVELETEGFDESVGSIAVSPDGRFVYATSSGSDALLVFARNPSTGALDLFDRLHDGERGIQGLESPFSIALSPQGENVYVGGDETVVTIRRAPGGAHSFVDVVRDEVGGVKGLRWIQSLAVSPEGAHVYVTAFRDDAVAIFERDQSNGELTFVDVRRDGERGAEDLEGATDVVVTPDGSRVFVTGFVADSLTVFERDPGSGSLTFLEVHRNGARGIEGIDGAAALALDASGDFLYATGLAGSSVAVLRID